MAVITASFDFGLKLQVTGYLLSYPNGYPNGATYRGLINGVKLTFLLKNFVGYPSYP